MFNFLSTCGIFLNEPQFLHERERGREGGREEGGR